MIKHVGVYRYLYLDSQLLNNHKALSDKLRQENKQKLSFSIVSTAPLTNVFMFPFLSVRIWLIMSLYAKTNKFQT